MSQPPAAPREWYRVLSEAAARWEANNVTRRAMSAERAAVLHAAILDALADGARIEDFARFPRAYLLVILERILGVKYARSHQLSRPDRYKFNLLLGPNTINTMDGDNVIYSGRVPLAEELL